MTIKKNTLVVAGWTIDEVRNIHSVKQDIGSLSDFCGNFKSYETLMFFIPITPSN